VIDLLAHLVVAAVALGLAALIVRGATTD